VVALYLRIRASNSADDPAGPQGKRQQEAADLLSANGLNPEFADSFEAPITA